MCFLRQRFDDHVAVRVVVANPEHLIPAHAVQRLEDGVAVGVDKGINQRGITRHQRRYGKLREFTDRQLFRMVAQCLGFVEDARAFGFGTLQQPGRCNVFDVEGRVLAHDHGGKIAQWHNVTNDFDEPVVIVVEQFQMHGFGANAVQGRPVNGRLLNGPYSVAGSLGGTHHGDA